MAEIVGYILALAITVIGGLVVLAQRYRIEQLKECNRRQATTINALFRTGNDERMIAIGLAAENRKLRLAKGEAPGREGN